MRIIILIIGIIMLSCINTKEEKAVSATVKYIDWEILTVIRVDCNQLESFKNEIKIFEITNQHKLSIINNYLKKLKIEKSKLKPDVRVKIEIHYKNKTKILCIGNNGVIDYDKKIVRYNPEFVNFIKKLINENK